jgi:hypothetical protein
VTARRGARLAVVLGQIACVDCTPRLGARGASLDSPIPPHTKPSIEGARELDQQGVKAFADGRYADAVLLFRASQALGGPSSESWNVARCLERLDDGEGAAAAIDEYLTARDLAPQDRAQAEREARALSARPSQLTVTTSPAGATVTVDGQPAGATTPASLEVRPGTHTIALSRPGYQPDSRVVEARYGRALVVALDLAVARK